VTWRHSPAGSEKSVGQYGHVFDVQLDAVAKVKNGWVNEYIRGPCALLYCLNDLEAGFKEPFAVGPKIIWPAVCSNARIEI